MPGATIAGRRLSNRDPPILEPAMRRALSCLALVCTAAASLSAQTTDEVIAKYAQRVGGLDRIQALRTLRRTGTFYGGGGFEAVVSQENKRPNKVSEEFTLQGMTQISAYDGKVGWIVNPFGGKKDAEAMGEDQLKSIIEDAEFDDPLFNYAAKGNKVAMLGTDLVEGSTVYKLQCTLAGNGDVRTYYIDVDNSVPIKIDVKRTVRGAEQEFEELFGDYKEVNGVYLPFAYESGPKGSASADKSKILWTSIMANADLADQRFAMPAPGTTVAAESAVPAQ